MPTCARAAARTALTGSLAALVLLITALVPLAPASAGTPDEGAVVGMVNAARAGAGLPPLAEVADLTANARAHAQHMAATGQMVHNPNLTRQVTGWSEIGENVAYGPSLRSIHDALMASPGHRANILKPSYGQVGIGVWRAGNGTYWVTEVFRRPNAVTVGGAIGPVATAFGSILGAPLSPEYDVPGGRAQDFSGGDVLWSPSTGARVVHGAILNRYDRLGGAASALGLPVTHETPTPDGRGRFNHFRSGSIYWSPGSGAQEVRGAIRAHWAALGWERSAIGYPRTDEQVTPDGRGRYNHFQIGSVYWSPATGAHEVRGAIRDRWAALGWERSSLGYPTSDEYAVPGGRRTDFERGTLTWSAATGAVTGR